MIGHIRRGFLFHLLFLVLFAGAALSQPAPVEIWLSGLGEAVSVRRDSRSIPYIQAQTDTDLYFAQGYVTASDRLWQMDLLRRVAAGESAEIFGKATLEEDKRWRRFGFREISRESLKYLQPEMLAALQAYARGVNAYIAGLDEKTLPIEFRILQYKPREWKPEDTILIGKILSDALSSTYSRDVLRASLAGMDQAKMADLNNNVSPFDVVLYGKDSIHGKADTGAIGAANSSISNNVPPLALAEVQDNLREASLRRVGLYAEELAASNNWVIAGKRTADGKPLLANDPHLLASAPGIWYLSHLSTPKMRVAGVTFPGVPGIVLGHNDKIAWGATNVGPDVQDIYLEAFNSEGKYKTPDGWADPVIRREEIAVRRNPLKPETETETMEVTVTRNGPVVLEDKGTRYSLKWTALDPRNNEFTAFFNMNRAGNWRDFSAALREYGGAAQNFVFADTSGNIGWYAAGKIPLRRKGDGSLPYDGASRDGDWVGVIPFEELPHLYNPPQGFIVTANQRLVGTEYKYPQLSRDNAAPWRARRLYDLLSANPKTTMDSASAAQYDVYNIPLADLAREITRRGAASPEHIAIIRDWDGRMTPDSRAALLVNEVRNCTANKIAADNRPAPAAIIRERILHWAITENSQRWLPKGFVDYTALLKVCDSEAEASLRTRYGADEGKWVWGAIAQSRFPHPLAVAPLIGLRFATPNVPIAGSGQTPNVASFVSMRHLASPGNWDATRLVIPLGESGDPDSDYYTDQFDEWRTGTPAIFPFSPEAVAKATVSITNLVPEKTQP